MSSRYVVPDLPKADYDVWVRGYGLVDSAKVKATPGQTVNLKALSAPDKKAAASYYPALYWYALMQMPKALVVWELGAWEFRLDAFHGILRYLEGPPRPWSYHLAAGAPIEHHWFALPCSKFLRVRS